MNALVEDKAGDAKDRGKARMGFPQARRLVLTVLVPAKVKTVSILNVCSIKRKCYGWS